MCFPKYLAKFLRTPFILEYLRWLFRSLAVSFNPIFIIPNHNNNRLEEMPVLIEVNNICEPLRLLYSYRRFALSYLNFH